MALAILAPIMGWAQTDSVTMQSDIREVVVTHSNERDKARLPMTLSVVKEQVIKQIAEKGSCVIVGRAADYVLKDRENLLRVFVYAPTEFRVKRIMEVYGDSHSEAVKNVKRSDSARASYYEKISGLKWGDRQNYDFIVNSSIGLEECAESICQRVRACQGNGEKINA